MSQSVNDRLDQSANGTPKLNPDEQRKYLGTFRERVSLAIKIKEMTNHHAIQGLKMDIQKHPQYQMIINGQLSHQLTVPYLKLANQKNVKFVIKTDSFYFTKPDSYGVVYASQKAINQYPIDVDAKYPVQKEPSRSKQKPSHQPGKFKKWLKHLF